MIAKPKEAKIPSLETVMTPTDLPNSKDKSKELDKSMTSNEKFNDSVSRNKEFIESLARKRNNCPDCDQDFHRHKDLQEHINTKEKLSHCTQCSFKSCNSIGMKKHIMESHNSSLDLKRCNDETSGDKKRQFKCRNCDQRFFNKSDLEVHLKTKDKLVKCSQCFFKSCTNMGLTKHRKTAHDKFFEPLDIPSTPNPQNTKEHLQKSESKGQLISE